MSRKRQIIVLVAAVTAIALVALVLVPIIASDESSDTALDQARQSCGEVEEFERGVEENDPAEEVLKILEEAEKHAERAASLDTAWIPLVGGIQSIRVALNEDDAQAAQVGINVTRIECRKTLER
jgi:type II secretory pathway component PulM